MMRQCHRQRVAAGLVAVCSLAGSLRLGAQAGEPISPPTVHDLTATIQTLNRSELFLTLEGVDPEDLFTVSPHLISALAGIEVGDSIEVTYYEARVVGIAIGGGGTLPEGVRPGQSLALRPSLRDATVTAFDFFGRSITVIFSDTGNERTFPVVHESLLVGVQVGDTVTLTVSRPLLTRLTFNQP